MSVMMPVYCICINVAAFILTIYKLIQGRR